MKKILFVILAVVFLASCTATLPARFTKLADKVEAKGSKFTEDQWNKANEQFGQLVDEYSKNYDSFNGKQKKEINRAIAKYAGAALKSGIDTAAETVEGILEELPNTLDSILQSAQGFLEGLGL